MNWKFWLKAFFYGVIFGVIMYGISRMINSFKTEYTEPEIEQPAE